MEKDWEKEQDVRNWFEKDRLFQFNEFELNKLTPDEHYDRMRYEREIEAHEFVRLLRTGMERQKAVTEARKEADKVIRNWNMIKKHPRTWGEEYKKLAEIEEQKRMIKE